MATEGLASVLVARRDLPDETNTVLYKMLFCFNGANDNPAYKGKDCSPFQVPLTYAQTMAMAKAETDVTRVVNGAIEASLAFKAQEQYNHVAASL